jgi:hypothetical protein
VLQSTRNQILPFGEVIDDSNLWIWLSFLFTLNPVLQQNQVAPEFMQGAALVPKQDSLGGI